MWSQGELGAVEASEGLWHRDARPARVGGVADVSDNVDELSDIDVQFIDGWRLWCVNQSRERCMAWPASGAEFNPRPDRVTLTMQELVQELRIALTRNASVQAGWRTKFE